MDLDALTDEVLYRCDVLGDMSDEPDRLTRTFLRKGTQGAHTQLAFWMADAGLFARLDAAGNLHGMQMTDEFRVSHAFPKNDPEVRFVVGSHIDTVPNAGRYDGTLGVLLGIAAAKALDGRKFSRRLDVVAFVEEEGVRFGFPYIGSLAVCGKLTDEMLQRRDADGITVAEAMRSYGVNATELPNAVYPPWLIAGYLEAHIEQGPVLESKGLSLGVVPAIMGQTRAWITLTGMAGHAGTQPMELRKDALAAAAAFVSAVEASGRSTPGMRATVGSLNVSPNAGNVVPGGVRLSIDVRHTDDALRALASEGLFATAQAIATERGLQIKIEPALEQAAVPCNPDLTNRLTAAMVAEGHPPEPVVSGAGHDAVVMADFCPTAMLFVRSPGGISHHPAESVRREDVRAALAVMIRFLEGELIAK